MNLRRGLKVRGLRSKVFGFTVKGLGFTGLRTFDEGSPASRKPASTVVRIVRLVSVLCLGAGQTNVRRLRNVQG